MPATPITPAQRYFEPGSTKAYFLTTIASTTLVPTRAELNAGIDFSGHVRTSSGWGVNAETIDTEDLASTYTAKIGGRTTSPDSGFECYQSKNGVDLRVQLPLGTVGYVVWMDGGDVAGNKMDIFPVNVISNSPMRPLQGAAMLNIQFSITARPAQFVTVPA